MTARKWKNTIKKSCQDAGTYRRCYESVIDTLASIMEARDKAWETYEKMGFNPVVRHTNKNGSTNLVKNPALAVALDCNAQALSYWRDLGLTPAGFKKLDGSLKSDAASFGGMFEGMSFE